MADGPARVFLVKVGSGNFFRFAHDELASMDGAALLEALSTSALFSASLRDVALDRCAVFVSRDTSAEGAAALTEDATIASLLEAEPLASAAKVYIRVELPGAAGVGGAVGELAAALASIAEGQREQGSGLRALAGTVEALRLDLAAGDADSFRSPTGKEYEQLADSKADEFLAVYCGLRVLPASRRGIPATDSAARAPGASEIGAFQWDARFSTTCIPSWSAPVWKVGPFYVYGGGRFQQPPTPDKTRNLSPVKPVQAHYLAVLEYTLCTGWTDEWRSVRGRKVRHSLLPRLEARLHVCVERVREADKAAPTNDVTDAVGVVGVVGQDGCKESVEDLLSHPVCEFKLLKKMFDAGRFVFFFLAPMLPSSSAVFAGSLSAAGGERVAAGGT